MEEDEALQRKTGEPLILLLDRFEDFEKAQMLGRVFQSCAKGEVNWEQLGRFSYFIDRVFINDLK